eukprot:scaffold752_cov322-Pavlova_lutheri.AAC.7
MDGGRGMVWFCNSPHLVVRPSLPSHCFVLCLTSKPHPRARKPRGHAIQAASARRPEGELARAGAERASRSFVASRIPRFGVRLRRRSALRTHRRRRLGGVCAGATRATIESATEVEGGTSWTRCDGQTWKGKEADAKADRAGTGPRRSRAHQVRRGRGHQPGPRQRNRKVKGACGRSINAPATSVAGKGGRGLVGR